MKNTKEQRNTSTHHQNYQNQQNDQIYQKKLLIQH